MKLHICLLLFILFNGCLVIQKAEPISHDQLSTSNTLYIITKNIDLNNETLYLPANCTLKFDGGKIINGELVGNNTKVVAGKEQIFFNLTISGEWNNNIVYSEWLGFIQSTKYDNVEQFANLTALSKGKTHTHIYMQPGMFYTSLKEGSSPISLQTNSYFHNCATISTLTSGCVYSNLIWVYKKDNVTIDGGTYIGDMETHSVNGEWLHGIGCWGSTNVTIKNVVCKSFWGDGIDIIEAYDADGNPKVISENVVVENVKCIGNRRQGMSIEAVNGCIVENSEFSDTGIKYSTPPSAGIDIEAWNNKNEKIKNIKILGCRMTGNKGPGILVMANSVFGLKWDSFSNEITISRCVVDRMFVKNSVGIRVRNSKVDEIEVKEALNVIVNHQSY